MRELRERNAIFQGVHAIAFAFAVDETDRYIEDFRKKKNSSFIRSGDVTCHVALNFHKLVNEIRFKSQVINVTIPYDDDDATSLMGI